MKNKIYEYLNPTIKELKSIDINAGKPKSYNTLFALTLIFFSIKIVSAIAFYATREQHIESSSFYLFVSYTYYWWILGVWGGATVIAVILTIFLLKERKKLPKHRIDKLYLSVKKKSFDEYKRIYPEIKNPFRDHGFTAFLAGAQLYVAEQMKKAD